MTLIRKIEVAKDDAAGLERLYRQAEADGDVVAFQDGIAQCLADDKAHSLVLAWAYRLDLLSAVEKTDVQVSNYWQIAVGISVVLGFLFIALAGNGPPVPFPDPDDSDGTRPHFWLGWSPVVALAILAFLATMDRANIRRYATSGIFVVAIATLMAFTYWNESGNIAVLISLHLPFIIWAALGVGVAWNHNNPARQFHAFSVKSVETVLTGGIYFGAGMIFLVLTNGIFQVLDIEIAESIMLKAVAWNIGALSIIALASAYNPLTSPTAQDWTSGLTRLLGIITRLILPLALVVLAIYIFIFSLSISGVLLKNAMC